MTKEEQVKFCVSTEKTNFHCICTYEQAKAVIEDIKLSSMVWIEWAGRLNDIDSNKSEFCVRSEEIISADIITVNSL